MLTYKSFIDLLFILLLGTFVLLTESVQIGALDTVLTIPGANGISPLKADEVQLVVISANDVNFDGRQWQDVEELAGLLRSDDPVLLLTTDQEVRHHRVMDVWMGLRARSLDVKLGVAPSKTPAAKEE